MADLTPAALTLLLAYDRETGVLTWLPRPVDMFKSEGDQKRWNSNFAGKPALTADNGDGYKSGIILGQHYRAHRVAWALETGSWPAGQVDHENGDRGDNRFANFRDVSGSANQRNSKMQTNNTSGANGVRWMPTRRKWRADMKLAGQYVWLGDFAVKADAIAARAAANDQHGFSERHGQAA